MWDPTTKNKKNSKMIRHQNKKKYPNISSLRDVTASYLTEFKTEMGLTIYKRCSYVIQENKRVLAAAEMLKKGELDTFGKLMYASHIGLQNDYNVSCDELDFLVAFSKKYDTKA